MIEIIKTNPDDAQYYLFENTIANIYTAEELKNTLSQSINKAFLVHCYVLLQNNIPVARACLYYNPLLVYKNKQTVSVGNFESIDDTDCSNKLLSHLENEGRLLGASYCIGPMNGSTWDDYRFSAFHNEHNFFSEPYHQVYYNNLFTAFGFTAISHYVSQKDNTIKYDDEAILQAEKQFVENGLVIRNIDLDNFENELKKLYPFICEAFKNNFLYTTISEVSFLEKYLPVQKIIEPGFMLIAEDENKNIVGFIFCFRDFYNKTAKSLVVKTAARCDATKWKGLGHVLGNRIVRHAVKNGYSDLVHAFVINNEKSIRFSESFDGNAYKEYLLYGKEI
jgi:L-amino acid N-acyltransferase YncA